MTDHSDLFEPQTIKVSLESWDQVHALVKQLADDLASMLVSSNMAQSGLVMETDFMHRLVEEHAEMSGMMTKGQGNTALEELYGAVIRLSVGDVQLPFADSQLLKATRRARVVIEQGGRDAR